MVGRSKRRIFNIGGSKAITLPKEWIDIVEGQEVHVVFDSYLLVCKDEQEAENIIEKVIEKITGVEITKD